VTLLRFLFWCTPGRTLLRNVNLIIVQARSSSSASSASRLRKSKPATLSRHLFHHVSTTRHSGCCLRSQFPQQQNASGSLYSTFRPSGSPTSRNSFPGSSDDVDDDKSTNAVLDVHSDVNRVRDRVTENTGLSELLASHAFRR
jgi:hypothetical protein